jgi:DNA-binding response OmpR family regulator
MATPVTILWVDDEIDLLGSHIIFLEQRGYLVQKAINGVDAIELVRNNAFDIVFLDENMPGLSGLETLSQIKELKPLLPVVMVTKSEEENIMDMAVGSQIADYLIKPVNPNQILLSIKKHVHGKTLVSAKQTSDYGVEFSQLSGQIAAAQSYSDWVEIYRRLSAWQLRISDNSEPNLRQMLDMQMAEANQLFSRYIRSSYMGWFKGNQDDKPLLSSNLLRSKVFPLLDSGERVLLVLIDNLRYDQWKAIEPLLVEGWRVESDDVYFSILPTATQYARNAIFAGLMPLEIQRMFPDIWISDDDEEGKNNYELQLLTSQLQRLGKNYKVHYEKASTLRAGMPIVDNINLVLNNNLTVLVINFVDMMSHARTDSSMMKELASDEAAYISLVRSWFQHSDLRNILLEAARFDIKVVITTDHGSIRVQNPIKVVGDRATSTNLRYKLGRSLAFNAKEVFEVRDPETVHLPKPNVSSSFIFAYGSNFFVYPNNFNYFASYYRNTFQHGGISLEEMIIPVVVLTPNR